MNADAAVIAMNLLWTLVSGCLVFFMQAGFTLVEAGSVRPKNIQNIMLKNLMDTCIGGVVWWAIGFAFAYGDMSNGFIGTTGFFCQRFGPGDYANWFF